MKTGIKNGAMRAKSFTAKLTAIAWVACGSWVVGVVGVANAQSTPPFDVDNDGIDELLITETGYNADNPVTGLVRVVSGATGEELLTVQSVRTNDYFGYAVTPVGDANDDGVPDFLVTAPLAPRAIGLGMAYIYSGDDGRLLSTVSGLVSDIFGIDAQPIEDLDGDGNQEIRLVSQFVDMELNVWELATEHAVTENGLLFWAPNDSDAILISEGADLNEDGVIDNADLIELLLRMGQDDPPSDLDSSGVVDENDALLLAQQMGDGPPDAPIGRYPWWEFMSAEDFATWWGTPGDSGSGGGQDGDSGGGGGGDDGGGGGGGGGGGDDDEDYDGDEPEDDQEPEPCEFFDPDDTWEREDDCLVAIAGPCGQYIGFTWPSQQIVIYIAFGWPLGGEYTWSVSGAEDVITDGPICIARVSRPGTLRANVTYTVDGCNASAFCESRVVRADLDIDSDNDNDFDRPDRSAEEEDVEDELGDELLPGKVILANTLDFDNDGIPGYADGYDLLQHTDFDIDDRDETADFPFAVLGLSKLYCDDAKIRISYDASPPLGVRQTVNAPFVLPVNGSLRLWRNDRPNRDPRTVKDGGHYIAPGEYTREELGLTAGKASRRFYVEVVRPSQVPGDIEITVEYSPREDVGYIARDRVRITGSKIELWGTGYGDTFHPVGALIKTSVDDPNDPDWEPLPDGFTPGAWMQHYVRVYDPRKNLLGQMSIDRWPLVLSDEDSSLHSEEFMCQSLGYGGPLTGDTTWVILDGEDIPSEYNPYWLWRVQPELEKPPRSNATMQELVDDAVEALEDDEWRPGNPRDPGAFGKRIHSDIAPDIRAKRYWYANVIIDTNTREIIKLDGAGNGSGHPDRIEVDAIKCDKGYTLRVGETFDPNRAWVYEVKCAKDGKVRSPQKEKLDKITAGGRKWQRTISRRVWSAADGGKFINGKKFAAASAALAVIGGGRTAWAIAHADDYDDDLKWVMIRHDRYLASKQVGNTVMMEINMQDLILAIQKYVSNFTDHPAANLIAKWATVDRYFGEGFNP